MLLFFVFLDCSMCQAWAWLNSLMLYVKLECHGVADRFVLRRLFNLIKTECFSCVRPMYMVCTLCPRVCVCARVCVWVCQGCVCRINVKYGCLCIWTVDVFLFFLCVCVRADSVCVCACVCVHVCVCMSVGCVCRINVKCGCLCIWTVDMFCVCVSRISVKCKYYVCVVYSQCNVWCVCVSAESV